MTELMIPRADASDLGNSIRAFIDDLEADGFNRNHIGAAMVGIGIAVVRAHDGHDGAVGCLNSAREFVASNEHPHS